MTLTEKKHRGCRNELIASLFLMENGYEVFRAISQHGAIDLVGVKENKVVFFDVKMKVPSRDGGYNPTPLSPEQQTRGVKILHVYPNGDCVIQWDDTESTMPRTPRKCARCPRTFLPYRPGQKYCSQKCGNAAANARHAARRK